jgi:hypothetical protein
VANGLRLAIVRMIGWCLTKSISESAARLNSPGERNHHSRRRWVMALPRSRKNTFAAETKTAPASVNTYCTPAMTGIHRSISEMRSW